MARGLVDLDELVLRCRDDQAREYLREAVACYKAAAFRSSIVATWTAVVFDILHKLRELQHTGDKEAEAQWTRFEGIRAKAGSGLQEALKFERGILELAETKFELLTEMERTDLERLQEDRHRCAHPSMQALDVPYEPTAELARLHIRNAVELLLEREPVQGKAALARVWSDIKSDYFPDDAAEAERHFAHGPLKRARKALVRGVIIGLTKAYLNGEQPFEERRRIVAALIATIRLHSQAAVDILGRDLALILDGVPDERWNRVVLYVGHIPHAWIAAGTQSQDKVRRYIKAMPVDGRFVWAMLGAVRVSELRKDALERLVGLDPRYLGDLLRVEPLDECIEEAVRQFEVTKRWDDLAILRKRCLPVMCKHATLGQLSRVVRALRDNSTIRSYLAYDNLMREVLDLTAARVKEVREEWVHLDEYLGSPECQNSHILLRAKLREFLPELPELPGIHQETEASQDAEIDAVSDSET